MTQNIKDNLLTQYRQLFPWLHRLLRPSLAHTIDNFSFTICEVTIVKSICCLIMFFDVARFASLCPSLFLYSGISSFLSSSYASPHQHSNRLCFLPIYELEKSISDMRISDMRMCKDLLVVACNMMYMLLWCLLPLLLCSMLAPRSDILALPALKAKGVSGLLFAPAR